MRAKDVMTEDPITATEIMTVADALSLLYEEDIRHLPITSGGELVGIVSDRDLKGFQESVDDPDRFASVARDSTVGALMNTSPIQIDPETGVREIVELMLLHRVGALPVTDAETNQLLGIVSYVDLLRLLQKILDSQ